MGAGRGNLETLLEMAPLAVIMPESEERSDRCRGMHY